MLLFWALVLLLTVLLWVPLSRLFFVLAARQREQRAGAPLDRGAQDKVLKHTRALAAVVAFAVSWTASVSLIGGS